MLFATTSLPDDLDDRLLEFGSDDWQYRDSLVPPPDAWIEQEFDDTAWKKGTVILGYGYGDDDIATKIAFGQNPRDKNPVAWFRRRITIKEVEHGAVLAVRVICDDAAVVYVNDHEVFRLNVPRADGNATPWAFKSTSEERRGWAFLVGVELLAAGDNVVAASVHQRGSTSTDLAFDLELRQMRNDEELEPFLTEVEAVRAEIERARMTRAATERQRALARLRRLGYTVLADGVTRVVADNRATPDVSARSDAVREAREQFGIEFFRVFAGDTLEKVAARSGRPVERLRYLNRKPAGFIYPGNDLACLAWYFRSPEETELEVIAALYETEVSVLRALNRIEGGKAPAARKLYVPGRFTYKPPSNGPGALHLQNASAVQDGDGPWLGFRPGEVADLEGTIRAVKLPPGLNAQVIEVIRRETAKEK